MNVRICLFLVLSCLSASVTQAQTTPTATLLVLNKRDNSLALINPTNQKVMARVTAGPDPHEVVASSDGKFAYISNYGGPGSRFNTLSVVDLAARKALPPIDLGPLHSAHGLAFAGGKVYFTAETNKIIGRYDPTTHKVDWALGIGQNRTHMLVVARDLTRIFTSNVNSDTISIIEQSSRSGGFAPGGPPGPPPSDPREGTDWNITIIPVGSGPEGFDLSPDEKEVWAANSHDGTISIIDVATKKMTQILDPHINFANRVKFSPDGKLVLVTSLGGGDLVIFKAASRQEIKRIKLGRGAAGILMEPGGARAYVACSPDDRVDVINLRTLEVMGHIQSGREPDGLAWAIRN